MTNENEYRDRLNKKLDALVAILVVAVTKIEQAMLSDACDTERLITIHKNLTKTLEICMRAKESLNNITPSLRDTPQMGNDELKCISEYMKFQKLPPINKKDIDLVDFTDLCEKLQEEN